MSIFIILYNRTLITGKSTLCNVLAGKAQDDALFPVSEGVTACTFDTTSKRPSQSRIALQLFYHVSSADNTALSQNVRKSIAMVTIATHMGIVE